MQIQLDIVLSTQKHIVCTDVRPYDCIQTLYLLCRAIASKLH